MAVPQGYRNVKAHKDSVQEARDVKEELGITWNSFFEKAAAELESDG